ncbi:pilin [Wenzhouxiangella sediminis]|nr:pilin [Wenzhouxiangella sediminis]
MKLRSVLLALLLAVVLATVGCERPATSDSDQSGEFSAWDAGLADRARLVEQLPDNAIAYARLPSPWGLAGAPKTSALGKGLDTQANRDAITTLQTRLPEVLAEDMGQLAPILTLLLETLRSPLEFALVGEGPQPLEADLIIEGRFDFETVAELDAAMAELTGQAGLLQLIEPAEGEGPGQILATMFPIFYDFDPDTRRARFLTGMAATAEGLAASYEWQPADESPARGFEERIDASGHGFFLWADMARLGPIMRQGLEDEQLTQFEAMGVFATRQLAMGYGSSGGKAHLAVIAEGSEGRVWDLSLPASGPVDFRSSGEPDFVIGAVLPGNDWLRQMLGSLGEDADMQLAEISDRLETEIGIDLTTVVDTFAGRMMLVDDANGSYLVHDGDGERWTQFWDALSRRFDIEQSSKKIGGAEIHHLVIPGIDISDEIDDLPESNPGLAFLMARSMQAGTHLFWMRENDRILIASVPQVLMARLDHPGDVEVGDWLASAGVDTRHAALFAALHAEDAPRRNYYAYIASLLGMADMLGTEIDAMAFPTARELDLPDAGTIGFGLEYVEGRLGLDLAFENNPGDLFYAGGGSLGGIAVVGVLAAVAVPAYQDYVTRSRLATALAATSEFRNRVATHVAEHGSLPDSEVAAEWTGGIALGPELVSAFWQSEPPGLRLILTGGQGLAQNAKLMLSPTIEDGRLMGWTCSSDAIEDKHLPTSCR